MPLGSDDLILAAYPLVHRYNIALYDALYVALALRSQYSFVTADRRLYQRIR
jgi:predicted nucleic acid-binding protein